MTDRELMKQALEGWDGPAGFPKLCKAMEAMRERLAQPEPDAYGYASRLAVAIWEQHYKGVAPQWKPFDDLMGVLTQIDNMTAGLTTPTAAPVQEPVKPYAYEYGRDNGDGTYSVVIDKGSLVQTQPAVYNYARPQNAHKEWPIKELFDHPPAAQRQPQYNKTEMNCFVQNLYDQKMREGKHGHYETMFHVVHRAIEAAYGIKGKNHG
jgi:hypothetical protein